MPRGIMIQARIFGACLKTVGHAVGRARDGHGPQMVVAHLLRLCGHGEHDDAGYVDPRLKRSLAGRDCLSVAESNLRETGWADEKSIETWRADASSRVEEAVAKVQREAGPDPYKEDWYTLSSKHLNEGHAAL